MTGVLAEMRFFPSEIAGLPGISSSPVRTVKKTIRERINGSGLVHRPDIRRLQVVQVGKQVGMKG